MSPKRKSPAMSYNEDTKLYRKRIKGPNGKWVDVYGRTKDELKKKIIRREAEFKDAIEAADSPTVWEYAKEWYRRRSAGLSQQMAAMYGRQLDTVILPVIGALRMSGITTDDIAEIMVTRAKMSRASQRDTVQTLKQLFTSALDAGIIVKDPTRNLKAGGKKPKRKAALTLAQEKTLLDAVAGTSAEMFVRIGLYTGMRREEICGLLWDCVNLSETAPHIVVRRAVRWPRGSRAEISDDLKSAAASRTIPIPPQLADPLRDLKASLPQQGIETRPVICNSKGEILSYSSMQSLWGIITRRSIASGDELGTKVQNHRITVTIGFKVTPHILRHPYVKHTTKNFVFPYALKSWILYAISMRLSGNTVTRSMSRSTISGVRASAFRTVFAAA